MRPLVNGQEFLKLAGAVGTWLVSDLSEIEPTYGASVPASGEASRQRPLMPAFFNDAEFDGQFLRTLGKTCYGMADLGECFATAARITPGDYDGWQAAWWATAGRVRGIGEQARACGHTVSAAEAFLRAAEYFRASYFFHRADLRDRRLLDGWCAQRECFRAAMDLGQVPYQFVEIPYEGTTLDGYFFTAGGGSARRATVISPGGYDGTVEEYYYYTAPAAI